MPNYSESEMNMRIAHSSFNYFVANYANDNTNEVYSNRYNYDSNNKSSCAVYYGFYGG